MLLDGERLKSKILDNLKKEIKSNRLNVKLAIIMIGDNDASKIYVKNKINSCKEIGIEVDEYLLDEKVTNTEVANLIDKLNANRSVTGIILQSPIPKHLNYNRLCSRIDGSKDVDGFTKNNIYNLYLNEKTIMPCTVRGIIYLLKDYNIKLCGSHCVIVGRGNIVGKPLIHALLNEDATVTIAHSKTKNLSELTKNADIVISATGIPHLITADMIKDKAVVVDVGVSRVDGKIVGDVDFDTVAKKAAFITPNPHGVGPMTVAMIMANLVDMAKER